MKKSIRVTAAIAIAALSIGCLTAMAARPENKFPGLFKSSDGTMPEISQEMISAAKENRIEMLDEKFANEEISEDEYNKAIEKIENGNFKPEMSRKMHKPVEFNNIEMPEFSQEKLEEMKENRIAALDEKFANEEISEDEYNEAIEKIENGNFKPHSGKKMPLFKNKTASENQN